MSERWRCQLRHKRYHPGWGSNRRSEEQAVQLLERERYTLRLKDSEGRQVSLKLFQR
jgi:hypothetical protein